jgi:predicted transcriptional regulator
MDQDFYDDLLKRLTALVVKLDERDEQIMALLEEQREFNKEQREFNRQQVAINVRLDNTLQAIKDLLERGQNGR